MTDARAELTAFVEANAVDMMQTDPPMGTPVLDGWVFVASFRDLDGDPAATTTERWIMEAGTTGAITVAGLLAIASAYQHGSSADL